MKKPLHIIKTWFETGDVPTQEQFYDAWDSFHHKDNGEVITDKTVNADGDVTFTFSDGQTLTIEKFIPDTSKPMEYIDGLVAQLNTISNNITTLQNNKVDKINGKGLSEANYTQTEKDKLAGLENYNVPSSQPINFIVGLQDLLNQIQQDITLKVDKEDGKGLSSNDYTDNEKNKITEIDDKLNKNEPAYFTIIDLGDVSGIVDIDFSLAIKFKMNLIGAVTLIFSNHAAYEAVKVQELEITASAAYPVTFPSGVDQVDLDAKPLNFDTPTIVNHFFIYILNGLVPYFEITNYIKIL